MNNKNINWIWSHRRKMSPHHLDIFVSGLINNGFAPALNYIQKNQLAVVLSGNNTYLFDDSKELAKLKNDILKQVQSKSFVKNLSNQNNELFGSLLLMSGDMRKSNLSFYSDEKLLSLYDNFIDLITKAPLIRVQLTGIDACWSKNSLLRKSLLAKAKNNDQYNDWVGIISHFSGESVARTEQTDFLLLVNKFYHNLTIKKLLNNNKIKAANDIINKKYEDIKIALSNHILKYEWVSSEYTGQSWDNYRWLEEIAKFLKYDPLIKIKEINIDENKKAVAKAKLLKQLNLNKTTLKDILNA